MNNSCSKYIFQIPNFQVQKHIWTKSVKILCCQDEFYHLNPWRFLRYQHYDCPKISKPLMHIWFLKRMFEKNLKIVYTKVLNDLNMQKKPFKLYKFVSNFDHWNLVQNGTYWGEKNDNPNYYVCVVMFQKYTGKILSVVYTLLWYILLWLQLLDAHYWQ
jgi:hypothetical protein